ncbi:hypothetical protein BDK51DRAFT_26503 [Blyttiomyces helicus]|uniref:Uncharacterized protein n=1 Tax=Blyttiomyces helicus TaxID=388810 RepID=A0A4P9WJ70_9FUNG|nr:hypothetical protein BDK51DRAFT_26503 [Blyttiomyces helicus]|eukprot:RKO92959.1 hypothetical protein BDK51DRAFT_26503 [Blyttiomyces helicus]
MGNSRMDFPEVAPPSRGRGGWTVPLHRPNGGWGRRERGGRRAGDEGGWGVEVVFWVWWLRWVEWGWFWVAWCEVRFVLWHLGVRGCWGGAWWGVGGVAGWAMRGRGAPSWRVGGHYLWFHLGTLVFVVGLDRGCYDPSREVVGRANPGLQQNRCFINYCLLSSKWWGAWGAVAVVRGVGRS